MQTKLKLQLFLVLGNGTTNFFNVFKLYPPIKAAFDHNYSKKL